MRKVSKSASNWSIKSKKVSKKKAGKKPGKAPQAKAVVAAPAKVAPSSNKSVNKSEEIRTLFTATPTASAKEVVATLKAKGIRRERKLRVWRQEDANAGKERRPESNRQSHRSYHSRRPLHERQVGRRCFDHARQIDCRKGWRLGCAERTRGCVGVRIGSSLNQKAPRKRRGVFSFA